MTAIAAAAVVPTAALAADGPDPVFAAINRHRQIEAAYVTACYEPDVQATAVSKLSHESSEALGELVAMTPTTLAGCAALLRYLEAHENSYDEYVILDNHSDNVRVPARDLLSRIAASLDSAA